MSDVHGDPSGRDNTPKSGDYSTGTEPVLRIRPWGRRVRVEIGGYALAESDAVLALHEKGHGPVLYFPRDSVRMGRLQKSDTRTHCPRKGDAEYYTIAVGSCLERDGVWSYPAPFGAASAIAGFLAFRSDAVDAFDDTGNRVIGPAGCDDCGEEEES